MINDCVFCRELNGSRDTNFATRYPEIQSRIIYETESLVAFPCIGQLVKGHFLIVPKNHDCTLAQTHKRLNNLNQELTHLLREVHLILGFELNNSFIFEHGALGPNMVVVESITLTYMFYLQLVKLMQVNSIILKVVIL